MENNKNQCVRYSGEDNFVEIPESYLADAAENYKAMNISGGRYAPYYLDGDKLLICCNLERPNPSNVFLIEAGGLYELRRLTVSEDIEAPTVLEALNYDLPPLILKPEEYKIIGFPYMLIRNINGGMPL